MSAKMFQVGDRVRVLTEGPGSGHHVRKGAVGTVRGIEFGHYAVEFTTDDFPTGLGHSCNGLTNTGCGNWMDDKDLELVQDEPRTPDRVTAALKYDDGKLRYDLIPARFMGELATVYTVGAKKYAPNNWRKGLAWSRAVAAMLRHLYEWVRHGPTDPEDGTHRLAKVAWYCATLIEYEVEHPELCDLVDRVTGGTADSTGTRGDRCGSN